MLFIDKFQFEIACAGQCMNPPEVIEKAGLQKEILDKISNCDELSPAEVGKLAEVLKVKPKDIVTRRNFGILE